MGYGDYDRAAHEALTTSRAALPTEKIFESTVCPDEMNPMNLGMRESRDSALHPDSTGIIFALDVTGSMGHIPEQMARRELPGFMGLIMDGGYLPDPQLLFMAFGDVQCDRAPLQVGQFESEAHLMDQWLTRTFLERGGGSNRGESYDMGFYVAARHTAMDCWEKRGRKGYFFMTGDEPHLDRVDPDAVTRLIGERLPGAITINAIAEEAAKTFHPFFIIPDLSRRSRVERVWRDVLGDRVICAETSEDICAVSATLIGLTEGTLGDLDAAGDTLTRLGRERAQVDRVIRAVEPYAASLGRGGPDRPADPATVPSRRRRR